MDDSSSNKQASSMAELMQRMQSTVKPLHKGDTVKGTITKLSPSEILMDIGGKSEAIVIEKDKRQLRNLLQMFKVGDTVSATVIAPESQQGYPVVSLRQFIDNAKWKKLEQLQDSKTMVTVRIDEVNRGGFVVTMQDGTSGFLPQPQITFSKTQPTVGQILNVVVYEIQKKDNKVIFSQKGALSDESFTQKTKDLTPGKKVDVVVTNVAPFGIFGAISLSDDDFIDGFVHISEVAWERTPNLEEAFQPGQHIEAVILDVDATQRRVSLSIKHLTQDPFAEVLEKVKLDQQISVTVKSVGKDVILDLGSEYNHAEAILPKEKVPPTVNYMSGEKINVVVTEIDMKKHRVLVSPVLLRKTIGYR